VLQRAAATVTRGKLFNLGLRFERGGPQPELAGRFNPRMFVTDLFTSLNPNHPSAKFSDDAVHMSVQCATQWDALSHVHYDGVLYNACQASVALSVSGAARHGIEHLAEPGIMSRGVLLDIARLKGCDALSPEYPITPDDLNEASAHQNVVLAPGDVLLVRTGHIRVFTLQKNRVEFNRTEPGLHHACAEWAHDHSVSAICADNFAVEVVTPESFSVEMPFPFHMLALRDMGCPLGEMFDMELLGADCAKDGRYEFLFCAPPLALTGGFGSPVNPLVLK
jgi:kynurenine formamidase